MQYHYSPLKEDENRMCSSRSDGAAFITCSLHPYFSRLRQTWVFESNWITKLFFFFFLKTSTFLCKHVWGLCDLLKMSVCLSWLSSVPLNELVLIDVFSKALLLQSLPVLLLFREITNCSANPPQRSHFKLLKEPVRRTAPEELGQKNVQLWRLQLVWTCIKTTLTNTDPISDVCTLGFWLVSEGGDAIVTTSHSSNVKVEGPHEKIQVTNIRSLEEFGLVHHG